MSLDISVERNPESLRDAWQLLAPDCADQDAYVQPFFLLKWGELAQDQWTPEYFVARREGKLVGLLPLYKRTAMGCRILGFPVTGSTPPFDLIAGRGDEVEVAGAIARALQARSDWDLLLLHMMDLEHPAASALSEALTPIGDLTLRDAGLTCLVDTSEGTFDDFMAARPRRFRKDIRRWTRRHEEMGEIRNVYCPEDISLPDAMKIVTAILEKSWKAAQDNAASIDRLTQLAEAGLAEGKLQLLLKFIGDLPTSYLLSFEHEGQLFPFHNTYDLSLNQIAPGQIQLKEAAIRAFDSDIVNIDLGGDYAYLRKWATSMRQFHEIRLLRPSLRSRLIGRAYLFQKDKRYSMARASTDEMKETRKEAAKSKKAASKQ